jgi:hypothetical protein
VFTGNGMAISPTGKNLNLMMITIGHWSADGKNE